MEVDDFFHDPDGRLGEFYLVTFALFCSIGGFKTSWSQLFMNGAFVVCVFHDFSDIVWNGCLSSLLFRWYLVRFVDRRRLVASRDQKHRQSSHRTLTELFTTCQNLLKLLLPPRFYHLQKCSKYQPNKTPNRHYILQYCIRAFSPDAILTRNGLFPNQMEWRDWKKADLSFFRHM